MLRVPSSFRLVALMVGLVAALAACQVDTQVTVTVEEDGSGQVEVAIGLDDEALGRVPDLDGSDSAEEAADAPEDEPTDQDGGPEADFVELVRTADLEATGWELSGPEGSDGMTWLRLTKPFGTPEEATEILAELTAGDVLSDLEVARSSSFGSDRYTFSGTADLSGGLEALADEALAGQLDGNPLGESPEAMAERYGSPVEDMVQLVVRAELPGDGGDEWSPELGGSAVDLSAESTVYDTPVLVLAGIAVLSVVALALLFVVRTLRTGRQA